MKKFTQRTKVLTCFAALMSLCSGELWSQNPSNMTGTVITQPCNNNGQIGVTVTNLTPPISYTYSNWMAGQVVVHPGVNSTTDNLSGIPGYSGGSSIFNPNQWQITASDGTLTAFMTLTLTPSFTFADSVFLANCPALSTVQATPAGGTAPYTYLWTNLNTFQTFNTNPALVPNGTYSLLITDGAGCMVSSTTGSMSLNVMSISGISVNISGTPANCSNGTATVTASGGTPPYTYLWSNSATTPVLSGLTQGWYSCVVTDANGCQSQGNYNLTQAVTINFNTTITQATCLQNDGAILSFVSGGTAPYTYNWSNGATTQNLSNVQGGVSYAVQITDANGCTRIGNTYVGMSTPITVTYTATPSSCSAPTGAATITPNGGAAPYTVTWNTFPVTTGVSVSSVPPGNYAFVVTDVNGCVRKGAVVVPPASTLNVSLSNVMVACPATTGNLGVSVSGSNPPFTYAWSNGGTTAALSGVPLGLYSCTVTDAGGCSVSKSASLSQNKPVTVGFNATPATCIFNADGSVIANATGGTAPYTYNWSNAQTGASISGLAPGNYFVSVTDANGCKNHNNMVNVGYNPLNNSCYCTITGTVYVDANNNCVRDVGENGVQNIQAHASGLGYAYTDVNGVYRFKAPSGTYTVSEIMHQLYPLASCQSNNQVVTVTAATNCTTTVNFANNMIILRDLQIITSNLTPPVPGNVYQQRVIVKNNGTALENTAQFGYSHDGQLSYLSCTPWALTQQNAVTYPNWYSITSGFPTLSPGQAAPTTINYNVPTNIPISTIVNFKDTIASTAPIGTSWLTDNTPWDNVRDHNATVVGAYDPNFKEVFPAGTGPQGDILHKDSVLTYVVHFQNTGTYFAQNVVVVDTLDPSLNLETLRPDYSDHQYTATLSEDGVLRFHFDNINLPWKSAYGDALSSGMFVYTIRMKSNLPLGTQIKNTAAIYFDYNEPIITNTTRNTLTAPQTVGINELKASEDGFSLFPNPARDHFMLLVEAKTETKGLLKIFDISGRQVSSRELELKSGQNTIVEPTGGLQSGVYLVQWNSGDLRVGKKLIITK
jgi:hypothetical protein